MKKICVITGTRAEYGLLYHSIKAIENSNMLELQLVVTGSHLSPSHGMTVNTIRCDNIKIDYEIDMLLDTSNKSGITKSMGLLMIQLASCFDLLKPDMILILGDRYEMLAVASCAVAMNIPIAHIGGGEVTEGAIDEQIRHALTKMSHIHFATTETYKRNILKMGEAPFRVFNVGAPACENIKEAQLISEAQLERELNIKIIKPLAIVTYHPVTLVDIPIKKQIEELLLSIEDLQGSIIFTGSNADFGGNLINESFKEYVKTHMNCYFYQSLGNMYLNVCKYSDVMIGNSSSGIIEAACLRIPAVNIGERQQGRLRHANIIDVAYDSESIKKGIYKALHDTKFKGLVSKMENQYGEGNTSIKIVNILEGMEINKKLLFKKLYWGE